MRERRSSLGIDTPLANAVRGSDGPGSRVCSDDRADLCD